MSFREKSAWITLVSVLVCFGAYFAAVVTMRLNGQRWGPAHAHWLLGSTAALVLLQGVLNRIAAATTPKDGRAPRDEREEQIQWRSHTLGYYVLMVLSVGLFAPAHYGHSGVDMANFALLAVVIATLTVAVAQIVMFRRGV
jgi:cytochrome b561